MKFLFLDIASLPKLRRLKLESKRGKVVRNHIAEYNVSETVREKGKGESECHRSSETLP